MKKFTKQTGKLSLEKVQVTRLHNLQLIRGGNSGLFNGFNDILDDEDDGGDDNTWWETIGGNDNP